MNTLNIKDFSQKTRQSLYNEIVEAVKDSQRLVIKEHYDELLMSQEQFDMLKQDLMQMYQSNQYMFRTPLNIMEVRVQ